MTAMLRLIACAALLALAGHAAADSRIEYLRPEGLMSAPSFSQVTVARGGKLVFVSGQVAWDAAGKPQFPGDLEAQTRLAYENLRTALAAAGASFDDVVKYTVFVKDLDAEKWRLVSKVRAEFLVKEPRPASTMIGVQGLVYPELLIEIEAYAVVGDDASR
jgi:enamine deaminase RidA (YjgF/YER057c/UK114 family)